MPPAVGRGILGAGGPGGQGDRPGCLTGVYQDVSTEGESLPFEEPGRVRYCLRSAYRNLRMSANRGVVAGFVLLASGVAAAQPELRLIDAIKGQDVAAARLLIRQH